MNRKIAAALAASAGAVLIPLTVAQVTSASARPRPQQDHPGAITIESWLYAVPSENVLSGTVWDCFKISGAITDEGGGPAWTDDTSYTAPNTMATGGVTAASHECTDKVPAGGFIFVPAPQTGQYAFAQYTSGSGSPGALTTVYAVHTIAGKKGDIYITFSGTYNMTTSSVSVKLANNSTVVVRPLTTGPDCTWVITGGTGAYTNMQGNGTCFADAEGTFPYINHTEQGSVWFAGQSRSAGSF
jgi:hypothetical protein